MRRRNRTTRGTQFRTETQKAGLFLQCGHPRVSVRDQRQCAGRLSPCLFSTPFFSSVMPAPLSIFKNGRGDNPGGNKGVPVVHWMDPYETARQGKPRRMENLSMGASRREDILKSLGFSRKERMQGTRVANIIRRQRKDTNANRHLDTYHEMVEKVTRGPKKLARSPSAIFAKGKSAKPNTYPAPYAPPVDKSYHTDATNMEMSQTMVGSSATIAFDG